MPLPVAFALVVGLFIGCRRTLLVRNVLVRCTAFAIGVHFAKWCHLVVVSLRADGNVLTLLLTGIDLRRHGLLF